MNGQERMPEEEEKSIRKARDNALASLETISKLVLPEARADALNRIIQIAYTRGYKSGVQEMKTRAIVAAAELNTSMT